MQTPSGVTIDTSEQGSDEWKQARAGRFTASRAADLMKKQKNGKPYASRKDYITQIALERVTGELPDFYQSADMLEGTERERTAALAYSFATGYETEQTGLWIKGYYGASPDDLIVGQPGGVEYKNPKAATHYTTLQTGEIPEYYYWQVLQNLLVTGREWWDYVSYHPAFTMNAQLFIKRINAVDVADDLKALSDELAQAHQEAERAIQFINNYGEKIS